MSRLALHAALRGDLRGFLEREARAVGAAPRKAAEAGAKAVQADWRRQVAARLGRRGSRPGGGRKAANAIRLKVFDNADGGAAATVYSKLGKTDAGGRFVDYLAAHATGRTIRPTRGRWIYIPLQSGRRARNVRLSVATGKNIEYVPISGGRILIVRKTRSRSTPIALLVRFVRIPKTLDLDRVVRAETDRLPGRVVDAINEVKP